MASGWVDEPEPINNDGLMSSQQKMESYYQCHPFSSIGKHHLENGGKIIMPTSALEALMVSRVEFPYVFAITNPTSNRLSHCGVLEFTAEEGAVVMPEWMINNMQLHEGDLVLISSTKLEKGTYMKLQPHTKSFTHFSNVKVLLEIKLRSFSCLTAGDTIMIMHGTYKFYIDVVETQPCDAIDIIDTDCAVDFAIALDDMVPEKVTPSEVESKEEEEPKIFKPFVGKARRLDGGPLVTSMVEEFSQVSIVDNNPKTKSVNGKLVFGSKGLNGQKLKETAVKIEEGFQPFTGKKYKLKD